MTKISGSQSSQSQSRSHSLSRSHSQSSQTRALLQSQSPPMLSPSSSSSCSSSSSSSSSSNANGLPSPKSFATNKVKKLGSGGQSNGANSGKLDHTAVSQEEMQSLLAKLKELVPNMPRNKKLSKLEIIQHVIDYIFDLQHALESHPSQTSQTLISNKHSNSQNTCSSISPSRQPLGLLSPSSVNAYTASQLMSEVFVDKILDE